MHFARFCRHGDFIFAIGNHSFRITCLGDRSPAIFPVLSPWRYYFLPLVTIALELPALAKDGLYFARFCRHGDIIFAIGNHCFRIACLGDRWPAFCPVLSPCRHYFCHWHSFPSKLPQLATERLHTYSDDQHIEISKRRGVPNQTQCFG